MLNKTKFTGKTLDDAINNACISLEETKDNLYINELEVKTGLFNKKAEIEVITKSDLIIFLKEYVKELVKNMGLTCEIETKKREDNLLITIISDNNSILIGKNGKTLKSITHIIKQTINSLINDNFKFTLDIGEYKQKREEKLIRLAKNIARNVSKTKIDAKLEPMNSYERRIIHTTLQDNKKVYTESIGEEPNRCVIIKSKEE